MEDNRKHSTRQRNSRTRSLMWSDNMRMYRERIGSRPRGKPFPASTGHDKPATKGGINMTKSPSKAHTPGRHSHTGFRATSKCVARLCVYFANTPSMEIAIKRHTTYDRKSKRIVSKIQENYNF